MRWFFHVGDDGVIHLKARLTHGPLVGDAHRDLKRGERFYGLPYETLLNARAVGEVEVDEDGYAEIAP